MGIFGSSEEQTLDSTGEVNNNIVLGNSSDNSSKLITLVNLLCIMEAIKLGYILYSNYRRYMKKKYTAAQLPK